MELNHLKAVKKRMTMIRVCHHCGGMLRFYRGSLSCLMCGRDGDHSCAACDGSVEAQQKSA